MDSELVTLEHWRIKTPYSCMEVLERYEEMLSGWVIN